jgi:hypothetical protein
VYGWFQIVFDVPGQRWIPSGDNKGEHWKQLKNVPRWWRQTWTLLASVMWWSQTVVDRHGHCWPALCDDLRRSWTSLHNAGQCMTVTQTVPWASTDNIGNHVLIDTTFITDSNKILSEFYLNLRTKRYNFLRSIYIFLCPSCRRT